MAAFASIRDKITSNPLAILFFVLFLFAEYWNYQKGVQLTEVCNLTGPHEAYNRPNDPQRIRLDEFCLGR